MAEGTTALTVAEKSNGLALSQEKLELIRRTLAPDLTNDELALYGEVSKRYGLDPFRRQLYAIKRGGRVTFQTSIDGFRALAERSGKYRGQRGPMWCGKDGKWEEVWLAKEPPSAAKVGVLHADFAEPLWAVARWDSYAQSTGLWPKMPDLMLAKVAEALALRKAFPEDLSGLYSDEEMAQADKPTPASKPQARRTQAAQAPALPESTPETNGAGTAPPVHPQTANSSAQSPTPADGEIGNIDMLRTLASELPLKPKTGPEVDGLVTKYGFATVLKRVVNEHKLQCGSKCPHLASEPSEPEGD